MKNRSSNLTIAIVFLFLVAGCVLFGLFLGGHAPFERAPKQENDQDQAKRVERTNMLRTNTWYSNVYKSFPTEPLFALPGAYKFDKTGLSVGFPTVVGTEATVFGSFNPWCSLGMDGEATRVKIARSGDWDALFEVESGSTPWQVHMAQGSPLVTIDDFQGKLGVTCSGDVVVTTTPGGLVLKRGKQTILVQGKGASSVDQAAETVGKYQLLSTERSYRIILIPGETTQPLSFFSELAWENVLDTEVEYSEVGNTFSAKYTFRTTENTPVLTTLWPHHRISGAEPEIIGQYSTSIGTLRLIQGSAFVTSTSIAQLPTAFERVTDPVAVEAIKGAVRQDVASFKKTTPPAGVYFLGTWLGGVTSTAQIADLYGMNAERKALLDILQNNIVASLKNFTYRDDLKMLVAKNTEFGNDQGNDHHFHYGYYLRSAAVLATLRPEMKEQLATTMNELAGDIATTDRASTRYPYIRNFSPYDGHSWADSYASFGDGNNQESSSEALNAWYGLSLWGKVTGNSDMEQTGRALFATELTATKAYWFGENNPFPDGYSHTVASLVWGGKRDYATWFSGEAMHIHGIQWLPITPASSYLGTLPNFPERKAEILRAHPDPAAHEWGDLYTATLSYSDPQEAVRLLPIASKNQAMKSTSLLYQTVYQNLERSSR